MLLLPSGPIFPFKHQLQLVKHSQNRNVPAGVHQGNNTFLQSNCVHDVEALRLPDSTDGETTQKTWLRPTRVRILPKTDIHRRQCSPTAPSPSLTEQQGDGQQLIFVSRHRASRSPQGGRMLEKRCIDRPDTQPLL